MEYNGERLYSGLHLMYLGQLVIVIGLFGALLLLFIPGMFLMSLVGAMASLVGAVMSIVGQFKLRNEHQDYMTSLMLMVIGFPLNLLSNKTTGMMSLVLDVAVMVCSLAQLYFLIRANDSFFAQKGREDMIEKGKQVFLIQVLCTVGAIVLGGAAEIFWENLGIMIVLLALMSIMTIAAAIFVILYLKKSAITLR